MMKHKNLFLGLLGGLMLFSACRPVALPTPVSTIAPAPTVTEISPEPTSTPAAPPSPPPSPATLEASPAATTMQSACPALQTGPQETILQQGSLLFEEVGTPAKLWAFTAGHQSPNTVFSFEGGFASLDSEGRRVAFMELREEKALAIYDLQTGEKSLWPWAEEWKAVSRWTRDGRVKLWVSYERQGSIGETSVFALFDPSNGTVITVKEELDLPGYTFESNNPWGGYVSLNGAGNLAVYTAWAISGALEFEVILRDISKGTDLWRYAGGKPFAGPAAWSPDDSKVAFALVSESENHTRIVSLTSDGRNLSELTHFPPTDLVDILSWSLDGKYLLVSLFEGPQGGPSFVLNTLTGEIREVCDPKVTFYRARWVSVAGRNLLVYLVYRQDETGELRLLDVDSWQAEVLSTVNIPYQIDMLGWTPVEFP
ncbi:TolB family protein [Candidatus Roseilinea sp. NK_OTU-006]|uniref:TolB family protein n=1 Tax=Candidatus Roseilinea sp. NK_OTU-006 TaxID=2704250 RepID=UPI00145EC23D|nr:hypothetical protein [Candidatus Roseilinea sp. NK_OTU-006]